MVEEIISNVVDGMKTISPIWIWVEEIFRRGLRTNKTKREWMRRIRYKIEHIEILKKSNNSSGSMCLQLTYSEVVNAKGIRRTGNRNNAIREIFMIELSLP
jgi:hypothetical protein